MRRTTLGWCSSSAFRRPDAVPTIRAMVATTEELLELHGRIRECTACPLHATRIQAVPGYGPVTARIMAVGEGPGETEDREGKPFVGAAGQLLTRLLESVGLDRRDIYITNIIKCRPPGNRDPEQTEVDTCSHFLDEQIEMLCPDLILVLGRHALSRLLPGAGDARRRPGDPRHLVAARTRRAGARHRADARPRGSHRRPALRAAALERARVRHRADARVAAQQAA